MTKRRIIVDSPDGCGKTEISKALSKELDIPYFKVNTERENWKNKTFHKSLLFDYVLPQFIEQTGVSFISDRGYPSEYVYAGVFKRETDYEMLEVIDKQFADLGTIIIVPLRRNYKGSRPDDLVSEEHLEILHYTYLRFLAWTHCRTITIYVDDFKNDLARQIPAIVSAIDDFSTHDFKHVTLGTTAREERYDVSDLQIRDLT